MVRLCSLFRAIIMRINSIGAKRKYFSKIYWYLLRLHDKMGGINVVDIDGSMYVVVTIKDRFGNYSKYAIGSDGKVYKFKKMGKNDKPRELNEVEELEAMKELEIFLLDRAKILADRLGLNVEKILNPSRRPRKKKIKKNEG